METTVLVGLVVLCGGAALYLWLTQSKLQDQLAALTARADKADAESARQTDRAETLRKKLEGTRDETSREDRSAKDLKARAAEAKEEVKRLQAALKRSEARVEEIAMKGRKADSKVEELSAMLAERSGKRAVPRFEEPAPESARADVEPMQAELRDTPPPVPTPEDPKYALRRAELDAEREQRQLEVQRLKLERDGLRVQQQAGNERELLEKLRGERERLARMVFERELDLRVARRQAEDNRRAYLMTMGALDLAEDEIYRTKHGRERPEFTPSRASGITRPHGVDAPERGEDMPVEAITVEPAQAESAAIAAAPDGAAVVALAGTEVAPVVADEARIDQVADALANTVATGAGAPGSVQVEVVAVEANAAADAGHADVA